ncbi:glycoside hydrolase [Aspergillus carlsbadensis]|nr:glycoside hydrolase [Aspergillus carlsbadensis]
MSFSKDFLWGFSTSAYQIEGAATQDGRAPSIWDTFCDIPGKIIDDSSGAVACDSYNRWEEDIALLKSLGAKAYRFSVSWSRVIPLGGRNDPINQRGLDFYVRFVDALLDAGITPFITLFHWDLPQALETRYGGLRNRHEFPRDFEHYARTIFAALHKCKHWNTFNELWASAAMGYGAGRMAPGRTSDRTQAAEGDSAREPWQVGHNLLVAHGLAVRAYRRSADGDGEIGIALNGDFAYPWDAEDAADVEAATRHMEFVISWFADPIYFGEYPASMRAQLGERLPQFTEEERELVLGSSDFYSMNHYTSVYVRHKPASPPPPDDDFLGHVDVTFRNKVGDVIGPETEIASMRPHPRGFRDLLVWVSKRYGWPNIYVTENGTSIKGESLLEGAAALDDVFRVEYLDGYVRAMADAVREDGVNVRGYMAWSLLDNFEWTQGYQTRFGVTFVDFKNGLKRFPKRSAASLKPLFESLTKSHGA